MTQPNDIKQPITVVLNKIALPVSLMLLMLLLSWADPLINTLQTPYSGLNSKITELALWFSDSGHLPFVPLIGIIFLLILISRQGLGRRTRVCMVVCAVFISSVFAGGGAWLNENIIKTYFKYPRPNIEYLAGENGSGSLGMTAMIFYQITDE